MANGYFRRSVLNGIAVTGVGRALLVGLVGLWNIVSLASVQAAAGEPVGAERVEIHCDGDGCSLSACLTKRLLADFANTGRYARVVPHFVDSRLRGFRLYGLRPERLPVQLGLENGDVLIGVNGKKLTTPKTALAVYLYGV